MSLKPANWSTLTPPPHGHNKMSLATILDASGGYRFPNPGDAYANHSAHTKPYSHASPAPSTSSIWSAHSDCHSDNPFGSDSSSTTLSSNPSSSQSPPHVLPNGQTFIRSATIYSRKCRENRIAPKIGTTRNGLHFCSYVSKKSNIPCARWTDGFGSWNDLLRHADTEHGPEEVELIEKGEITYNSAQYIRWEEQLKAIKYVLAEWSSCKYCGKAFASNRYDSIERHIKNGVCDRYQQKRREQTMETHHTIPKRKGGKTSPTHKRR